MYFGRDPETALRQYLDERADWQAGRDPRIQRTAKPAGRATVDSVCEAFLAAQQLRLKNEEIRPRTFYENETVCRRLREVLGADRLVTSLTPFDFERLKSKLSDSNSPQSVAQLVRKCKVPFLYAWEADLLTAPVKFGPLFRAPGKRAVRQQHNARQSPLYSPAELRKLIDTAPAPLRAYILLGLNGAYAAADISTLPLSAIDLKRKWINHERAKTAVMRRCPLWPETVVAIREALEVQVEPQSADDAHLAFLSPTGTRLLHESPGRTRVDNIGKTFREHLKSVGLYRRGVGFYALRHCFRNAADNVADDRAIDMIMGHVGDSRDMSIHYVHQIEESRLRKVTNTVRRWLQSTRRAA